MAAILCGSVYAAEIPIYSGSKKLETGYLPGESHHTVDADDFLANESEGVSLVGDAVQISGNGNAAFGFYIRYATRGLTVNYNEGTQTNITIDTGDNTYNMTLDGDGTDSIDFGTALGISSQRYTYNREEQMQTSAVAYYDKEFTEKRGEKTVKIYADGNVTIKSIVFEKEKTPVIVKWDAEDTDGDLRADKFTKVEPVQNLTVGPNLSERDRIFMTTILMDEAASAILVGGARRYISNDDTGMRPYNNNGTLYIPIKTLAKALGLYCEDDPNRAYALMRSDTDEVIMIDGETIVRQGVAQRTDIKDSKGDKFEPFIYRNGNTLAAVRYFAELAGFAVEYVDGLVIIDNKYAVRDILNSDVLFEYADSVLDEFEQMKGNPKTYHVSVEGDDSNGGRSETYAFRTLDMASRAAIAGDTVIVHGGVYEETLTPKNNGTPSEPITFMAAEGEDVIISAADEIDADDWQIASPSELGISTNETIYKTEMDWDLGVTQNQVFVNDVMQTEARYPNAPGATIDYQLSDAWPVRGDFQRVYGAADENVLKVQSPNLLWNQPNDYWKGGIYVGLFGNAYNLVSGKIEASNSDFLTIGKERTNSWGKADKANKYNWGYIVGHKNALDAKGEWIKQGNTLYMIFPDGKTPQNCKVAIKRRSLVADLNNKSFINLIGFKTIGGTVRMDYSEMCMVNGFDMKYAGHFIHAADGGKAYVDFDYSETASDSYAVSKAGGGYEKVSYDRFVPKNNRDGAPERGVVGNYIGGRDNIFINTKVDHSAGAGLLITGLYAYIENNNLNDVGYAGNYVSGISLSARPYDSITETLRGGHFIHNNTVARCGRSAMNVIQHSGQTPYLPCDIGYNDFHDGMLTSYDTGITYEYYVNMGYDGLMTNMHHNYVYMTTSSNDTRPLSSAIYHDGGSFGVDTFGNKIFYTQPDGAVTSHNLFEQCAEHSPANLARWDNAQLGYLKNGVGSIEAGHFTEEKPFYAGAFSDANYITYCNNFSEDFDNTMRYVARNGNVSTGTVINEDGYADFSNATQKRVTFPNVSFGQGANTLAIAVRGDGNYTHDNLEIVISQNGQAIDTYNTSLELGAHDLDTPETEYLHIRELVGTYDVTVNVTDYRSVQIGGIGVYRLDSAVPDSDYVMFEYAGNFDETEGTKPMTNLAMSAGTMTLAQTQDGKWTKYNKRYFSAAPEYFVFNSTGTIGREVQVCVGGTENVVATIMTMGSAYGPQLVKVDKAVTQGEHDVYLKFKGDGYTDVKYFGFLKNGADISGYATEKTRIYGGTYTDDSVSGNAKHPVLAQFVNPPNYSYQGAVNVFSNSELIYQNVTIPVGSTKFVMNYAADESYDGQKVEVWLDNTTKIAEVTTNGSGAQNFVKAMSDISGITIDDEPHTITLKFTGGAAYANAKVDWFGFN